MSGLALGPLEAPKSYELWASRPAGSVKMNDRMLSPLLVGSGQRISASSTSTPLGTVKWIGAVAVAPWAGIGVPDGGALTFSVTGLPKLVSLPSAR